MESGDQPTTQADGSAVDGAQADPAVPVTDRTSETRIPPTQTGADTGRRGGRVRPAVVWRGWGLAAAAATGLALTSALPAPDLGAVALVALVPMLWVAQHAPVRPRRVAGLGYLAGLVFFGTHMTWLTALGGNRPAGIAAWAALAALQATTFAVFFGLAATTRGWQSRWARIARAAGLAGLWVGLELVRAHVPFGGNAWGLLGVTQHAGGPLLDLARMVGVYGVSAAIVAINLALTHTFTHTFTALRRRGWRQGWPAAARWAAAALVLGLAGLAAPAPPPPDGEPVRLAVIQGNATFTGGNRGQTNEAVFARHVAATRALADLPEPPDLVIWPEGAADDDPLVHPERMADIRRAVQAAGAPILLGATTELGGGRYRTEALLFGDPDPGGDSPDAGAVEPLDRYAKRRLLPFGEFVPMSSIMRRLVPATNQLPYDKLPGAGLSPMQLDGVPFGTIICYESAYPEDARSLTGDGARFIVLITNNASFGRSWLAAQHLATTQLRAVEQGRPMVHAAISGISGVVGPDGSVRQTTGLYEEATIVTELAPRTGRTIYARGGWLTEPVLASFGLLLVAAAASRPLRLRRIHPPPSTPTTPAASATAGSAGSPAAGSASPAAAGDAPGAGGGDRRQPAGGQPDAAANASETPAPHDGQASR